MIRRTLLAAVAAMMAISGTALAQTHDGGDPAVMAPEPSRDQTAATPGAEIRGALDALAQDVMVAQQVGYLAADKKVQAGYALLGDQIALVNSEINRHIDELVRTNNLNLPRVMNEQARARFEEMKNLNRDQFAQSLVAFVNDVYPRIIASIDTLRTEAPDAPAVAALAANAVPRLREQMQTAQQLAQGNGVGEQKAEDMNRGPIQRKDDPSVIPDTTPPIQR